MKSVVTCGSCNRVLDEDPAIPPEKRPLCPYCGSTSRAFLLNAESGRFLITPGAADLRVLNRANLLLQAVVIKGPKTHKGHIIESIAPAWFEIARILRADSSYMFQIDDRKWEELVAGIYKQAGFDEVILTPRSGDLGRDVIAIKHGFWTVRFVEQVKAYAPGHLVTANDVRALLGVVSGEPSTTKGIITTTSDFAPKIVDDPILKPHIPFRIELVNGVELIRKLETVSKGYHVM